MLPAHPNAPVSRRSRQESSMFCHKICKAKHLLLRDIRPIPTPASQNDLLLRRSDMCPNVCIYCDIWKLAVLVYSRVPTAPSTPTTPTTPSSSSSYNSSSSASTQSSSRHSQFSMFASPSEYQYTQSLKRVSFSYHQQRACLGSIISICTVEGAEESIGLRAAHDRCLAAVLDLIKQERAMERRRREEVLREQQEQEQQRQAREAGCRIILGARMACSDAGIDARRRSRGGNRRGSVERMNSVACAM